MRLRVSRLAQWDIDQIYDHIAADKPAAARRWVERTRKQFKFLAKNPHVGEARDEIEPTLRSFSHRSLRDLLSLHASRLGDHSRCSWPARR